jgi:exonuclease III
MRTFKEDIKQIRNENRRQRRKERFYNGRRWAIRLLGAAALAAGAHAAHPENFFHKSGELHVYPALPDPDHANGIDNDFVMVSWNMHGEAAKKALQIGKIAKKYSVDVFALQEVNAQDAEALRSENPGWNVAEVIAEPIQHDGYGDVLMSRDAPTDIKKVVFDGTSIWQSITGVAYGAARDMTNLDTSMQDAKEGWQEKRAAIAFTVHTRFNGSLKDVRVVTSHILHIYNPEEGDSTMHQLHDTQFSNLLKFVSDNKKDGRPMVFGGDLNDRYENVQTAFLNIGLYVADNKTSTLTNYNEVIDHFAYDEEGVLGEGVERVLPEKTDHYPIEIEFDGNQMTEENYGFNTADR